MLLALNITSTVAGVIGALAAVLGARPQRRTKTQIILIIVDDIKASAAERQPVHKPKRARSSRRARRRLMPRQRRDSGPNSCKDLLPLTAEDHTQGSRRVIRGNGPLPPIPPSGARPRVTAIGPSTSQVQVSRWSALEPAATALTPVLVPKRSSI